MFVSSLALTARYPSDDLRAFGSLNTRNYGGFVSRADRLLHEKLRLPAGYSLKWSGEYEFELRANERLKIILPIVFRTIALEKPSSSPSAPRISCNVAFRYVAVSIPAHCPIPAVKAGRNSRRSLKELQPVV